MADEYLENDVFFKSPQLTPWESFRAFLWNSESRKFLGRTGLNWAKITVFYILFYSGLACVIAVFFSLFWLTIDPNSPKWTMDSSLIGTNPGLGFRPMLMDFDSTLIWFKAKNKTSYQPWVDKLTKDLDNYYSPRKFVKGSGKIRSCSHSQYPASDEVCEVDVQDWGQCTRENDFNYDSGSPCIFIKLNKIYGWTPDYYLQDNELPSNMPKQLKDHITKTSILNRKVVWLSCDGDSPADKQHIGPITYYPKDIQGFPGYYFPYLNRESYLGPLVAVRFENPRAGVLINVECRAWAKNIQYDHAERIGSVHFQVLVDK